MALWSPPLFKTVIKPFFLQAVLFWLLSLCLCRLLCCAAAAAGSPETSVVLSVNPRAPDTASSVDRKKEEGKLFILLKLANFFYFLSFQLSLQAAWAIPFPSFSFLFLPFWLSFILFLPFWLSFPFSGGISYSPFFKLLSLLAIL